MKLTASAAALCCALFSTSTLGGPAAYVHTPIVDYGEREIDVHGGRAWMGDATRESALAVGLGYGVTPWWFTEAYVIFEGATGEPTKAEAVEWENVFQLTETGKYAADIGVLLEIERPRDHAEGYELVYGPLLQTESGRLQLNANLLFESHVRAAEKHETEMKYEWQAKLRWRPVFEAGLQGFGEMGEWNHWAPSNEQSHVLGPAIFGKLRAGARRALKYDAALLFAASPAAPDRTFRFRVEWEY